MTTKTRAVLLVSPAVALSVAAAALQTAGGRSFFRDSEALGAIAFIGFAIVGAVILVVDRRHAMGRIFYVAGLVAIVMWAADNYARYSLEERADLPGELLAAWLQNWLWFLPIGMIFTLGLLLFPDGRPPSPRWRPAVWLASVSLGVLSIAFMLHGEPLDGFPALENPTGILGDDVPLAAFAFGGVVISALAAIAALGWRFKRSRGTERLQMKWVVYAAAMMVLANIGLPVIGAEVSERTTDLLFGATTLLFPVACGIAILKYRLYDIDVIVNRTLVYVALTLLLAGSYLVIVVSLQRLLEPLTKESDLAIAASTLAVAALFRPLRTRIQAFIDHRFYRRKYDAIATLEAFSGRMRDQVDLEALSNELVDVVGVTLQPRHAGLWLRAPAEQAWEGGGP